METQQFCLKWNSHQANMLTVFEQLLSTEALVDVTLACDGLSLKAHKVVLSACSPYFQSLFVDNPCKHPIVIMKDMRYSDLKAIIDFMYKGEVNVSHDQLNALLKTAETLKVKGLAEMSGENRAASAGAIQQNTSSPPPPTNIPVTQTRSDSPAMLSKRKHGRPRKRFRSGSVHSDEEIVPTKIKEPESPEIEELPQDPSDSISDSIPLSSKHQTPTVHSSAVNNSHLSRKSQSSRSSHQTEEPPSESDFSIEPSKLMEQTLTTTPVISNGLAQSSSSGISVNTPSSLSIVPTSLSIVPASCESQLSVATDSHSSNQTQGPDSPQDVKPLLSFEEPLISIDPSQDGSAFMDSSGVPSIAGTSSSYQEDQTALVPQDSQSQDQPTLQTVARKSSSELPTIQPMSEEKIVTKPATDLKPASFFFSPVDERKSAVVSVLQKDIPLSHGDISGQQNTAKGTEIFAIGSPSVVSVTSSNEYTLSGSATTSANQQIQSSTPSQSISNTLPAVVSNILSSTIVPTAQIIFSSAESSTYPSVLVVQSPSTVNQKENSGVATQDESPLSSAKLSASTTASSTLPPSPQLNVGKVAAFTFALPKDLSNMKEVKNAGTGATTSTASSTESSAPSSGESSAFDQSGDAVVEKSATPQKTMFGSVPSATVTSSATVFGQPSPITLSTVPSSTPPTQPVFGQTAQVNTGVASSGSAFGVAAAAQPSSVFVQKPVTIATTTSAVSTTATTTASTTSFFGQQATTQSSFFGKTTLTSQVFWQAPPAQRSVFGQTVSNASSPSFGQTGTSSFFNQTTAAGAGSVFGQKPQSPGSSSAFGQSTGASGFSFQKASMEQQNAYLFALMKSLFGQNPVLGQQQNTASSPFGQPLSSSALGGIYGQGSLSPASLAGIFGQGSFFSGLVGNLSENASKNVFALTKSSPSTDTNIFGNQGASSFGSELGGSFSGGSFSSGSGSVAQSGFGAFQQTPQKTSGFGAPPSIEGSPAFGNSPNFGGSPSFGSPITSTSPLENSSFGSTQGEGFGSFPASNSPTFGTLASQSGEFGGAAPQQTPTFGSLTPQSPPSAFGAGSPVSGATQQASFGSPTGSTQSFAFSQWRN